MKNRGMTLVDVLALLVAGSLLLCVVAIGCDKGKDGDDRGYVETVMDSNALAWKSKCAANLRAISQGLSMYLTTHEHLPSLGARGWDLSADPVARFPLARHNEKCNLQAWYLLVKGDYISRSLLKCPGDEDFEYPSGNNGFTTWNNSSYAQMPTSEAYGGTRRGRLGGSKLVWSDRPLRGSLDAGTANHAGRFSGGNFLSLSGAVTWRKDNQTNGDNAFKLEDRNNPASENYLIWSDVNNPPE